MADRYIDSTYVGSFLGSDLVTAITGTNGVVLNTMIESATGAVQMYMRNSGYPLPNTVDPTDVEEVVKTATLGALIYMLLQVPQAKVKLPDEIDNHTAVVTWRGILNGDSQLAATPDVSAAVGGWQSSESNKNIANAFVQKASREELKGY